MKVKRTTVINTILIIFGIILFAGIIVMWTLFVKTNNGDSVYNCNVQEDGYIVGSKYDKNSNIMDVHYCNNSKAYVYSMPNIDEDEYQRLNNSISNEEIKYIQEDNSFDIDINQVLFDKNNSEFVEPYGLMLEYTLIILVIGIIIVSAIFLFLT